MKAANLASPTRGKKQYLWVTCFLHPKQWKESIITDKYMGRWARVWILNNILFSYVKCPITPSWRFLRRHIEKLLYGTLYVLVLSFLLFHMRRPDEKSFLGSINKASLFTFYFSYLLFVYKPQFLKSSLTAHFWP